MPQFCEYHSAPPGSPSVCQFRSSITGVTVTGDRRSGCANIPLKSKLINAACLIMLSDTGFSFILRAEDRLFSSTIIYIWAKSCRTGKKCSACH